MQIHFNLDVFAAIAGKAPQYLQRPDGQVQTNKHMEHGPNVQPQMLHHNMFYPASCGHFTQKQTLSTIKNISKTCGFIPMLLLARMLDDLVGPDYHIHHFLLLFCACSEAAPLPPPPLHTFAHSCCNRGNLILFIRTEQPEQSVCKWNVTF